MIYVQQKNVDFYFYKIDRFLRFLGRILFLVAILKKRGKIAAFCLEIMLIEGLSVLQHGAGPFKIFRNAVAFYQLSGGNANRLNKQSEYAVKIVGEAVGAAVYKE